MWTQLRCIFIELACTRATMTSHQVMTDEVVLHSICEIMVFYWSEYTVRLRNLETVFIVRNFRWGWKEGGNLKSCFYNFY